MDSGCRIAVIADDLTGAADTGCQFCPVVGEVLLAGGDSVYLDQTEETCGGLAVFTNSRHLDRRAAAETVRRAAARIARLAPQVVYKKLDSCLRGNLGSELDAVLQATGAKASFVAPAFPLQGRTTVDDCHLVNGVPVAETEIGRDPRSPVKESKLSALLAEQSCLPVGHVDLGCIAGESAGLAERIDELLGGGCRHIAFDATTDAHLDKIVDQARRRSSGILLAGSAGLAAGLARSMDDGLRPVVSSRPKITLWLFVCGSASAVMADQVADLARVTGWCHHRLAPGLLAAGEPVAGQLSAVAESCSGTGVNGMILSIAARSAAQPAESPERVVRGMAQWAAALLADLRPEGAFLAGGDTAEAFLRQIGAAAVVISAEILPGLMFGEVRGGPFDGLKVVTKAGAFGRADTLTKLIEALN